MLNTKNLNSIEQIAASIAHEVKNPLSLVRANIDLLESADLDKTYTKNYKVIKKELNKINEMMMDFLQLTKNCKEEYDVVYIYDIISSILETYKVTLGSNIAFYVNCEDKELAVLGHEKGLEKVFLNIFKNSVEAIDCLYGVIKIDIKKDNGNVIVNLSDNGVGINEEDMNKIGETFYTTKPNGSGLGFPICEKIIKEHNASISIKNNKIKGATVTVIFKQL